MGSERQIAASQLPSTVEKTEANQQPMDGQDNPLLGLVAKHIYGPHRSTKLPPVSYLRWGFPSLVSVPSSR